MDEIVGYWPVVGHLQMAYRWQNGAGRWPTATSPKTQFQPDDLQAVRGVDGQVLLDLRRPSYISSIKASMNIEAPAYRTIHLARCIAETTEPIRIVPITHDVPTPRSWAMSEKQMA